MQGDIERGDYVLCSFDLGGGAVDVRKASPQRPNNSEHVRTAPLFTALAIQVQRANDTPDALGKLESLEAGHLPDGEGFDSGCAVILEESTPQKLAIRCDFRHVDESGETSGWTSHRAVVTPCLIHGFAVKITGKNKNGIRDYIRQIMAQHLLNEVTL